MAEPSLFLASYVDSSQNLGHAPPHAAATVVPKLEDFLGDSSLSMMRYSDSQTETQDSSLTTHMYEHHGGSAAAYFGGEQQDLKVIPGFQAFSTANSGSEVDDSAAQPPGGGGNEFGTPSVDSSGNELAFSNGGTATGALCLGVAQSSEKAVVASDSDSSKKIADTFGQRTSIYRGVTRYHFRLCEFIYLLF